MCQLLALAECATRHCAPLDLRIDDDPQQIGPCMHNARHARACSCSGTEGELCLHWEVDIRNARVRLQAAAGISMYAELAAACIESDNSVLLLLLVLLLLVWLPLLYSHVQPVP